MKNRYSFPKHLARVMSHEYAESFLEGNIWINPISNYIGIEEETDASFKNSFRGDYKENSTSCIRSFNKSIFSRFEGLKVYFREQVNLDFELSPLCTLCFYLYMFDSEKRTILPDIQMKEFGDRVIIITNPESFFDRLTNEIKKLYPESFCMLHDVSYYDESVSHNKLYPVFEKRKKYSYQHELRYVVSKYGNPLEKEVRNKNMKDNSPIKLSIGSIRNIAHSISVDRFLSTAVCVLDNGCNEMEINSTLEKLIENASFFITNYKANSHPPLLFSISTEFFNVSFKNKELKMLQENLAKSKENSPRKRYDLD